MKTFNSLGCILYAITAGIIVPGMSFGQFQNALVTDNTAIMAPVFAQNTGNYIFEVAGNSYAVNVWDDPHGPVDSIEWRPRCIQTQPQAN